MARYLAGAVSPTERRLVDQAIATSPVLKAVVESIRAHQRLEHRLATSNLARGRALLAEQLGFVPSHLSLAPSDETSTQTDCGATADRYSTEVVPRRRQATLRRSRVWALAAGLAAGILGVAWWGLPTHGGRVGIDTGSRVRVVATGYGERSVITLEDGTRIILNAKSQLRMTHESNRLQAIDLDGEALFTVAHHGAAPFIVRSGAASVRVLGTTFLVRRYPEDRETRVVVGEGRISVSNVHAKTDGRATLSAGTLADVSDSGNTVLVRPDVDLRDYDAWTDGRLVFHATPLRDVLPELERHYGLTIRLADSTLAEQRFTAVVTNDPVNVILDVIGMTFNMSYARKGTTVTFTRGDTRRAKTRPIVSPLTEISYGK